MVDRWKRLAPLSGVVMVALVAVAIGLGSTPDAGASGSKVLHYYSTNHGRTNVQIVVMAYAALFALVYFASVANFLRARGADLLATTTVAAGTVMAVGLALGAGTTAILADKETRLSLSALQALNVISNDMWWPTMMVGFAVATLGIGVSMLRTGALPKALGIVTVVVGAVAISGVGSWFAFMASGPLTLVIAGYIYQRLGREAPSITLPDMPNQRAVTDQATTDAAQTPGT